MGEKLEVTLRISLDRSALEQRWNREVANDTAFYLLGLVHAQLTGTLGDECCQVEMERATGVDPALIQAMNTFAPQHKRALEALEAHGEVTVSNPDLVEVLQTLHHVVVTPIGSSWHIFRPSGRREVSASSN